MIYVAHEFEMQLFIRFILELVDHNLHARLLLLLLLRQKAAHFLQIPRLSRLLRWLLLPIKHLLQLDLLFIELCSESLLRAVNFILQVQPLAAVTFGQNIRLNRDILALASWNDNQALIRRVSCVNCLGRRN